MRGKYCAVEEDVWIGDGTRLGNFVLIRSHTRIGSACTIGSYVDIEGDVVIGDRVSLQSGCYITRGVVIADDVFCGPRVITMNDKKMTYGRPSLVFERAAPQIRRGARIGGGTALLPGVIVGENALIGAGSVVTRNVPDRAIVVGNPARQVASVPPGECL